MTKTNTEIHNALREWANKNYLITNADDDAFSKKRIYDHYKVTNPATQLSRATFGRYFARLFPGETREKHTSSQYCGIQVLPHPETPLPPTEEDPSFKVEDCKEEVFDWFNDRYVWTEDSNQKLAKKDIYARFKADKPASNTPDFIIGLCLRRECKIAPTGKFWKGILAKSRVCECCGQTLPE